ncbi:MAG TPA: Ig-like domain-containing protein, partial [Anseongella sp.]|nr:Ig-like domain-containing protein [Anseongella sp.]
MISLTVSFNQIVTVDESGGQAALRLETGSTDREAVYISGSGSEILTFSYTVQTGDLSADLDYLSNSALTLNGATIRNASGDDAELTLPAVGGAGSIAGQHNILVDGVLPVVTSVNVPANGYYQEGDVLNFTVELDENVIVNTAGGTPYLEVIIGTAAVEAAYASGSGTHSLAFRYTVQPGQQDLDGIALGSGIVLDGGAIRDAAGNDARLTLNNVAPTDNVFVYSVKPGVTLSTAAASPVNQAFTVTLQFSEAVTGFTLGDITAANTGLSFLQTTDNITYTALVTPLADGAVSLQVPAGVARNIGNNDNTASNTLSLVYDGTAPAVTSVDVPAGGYYGAGETLEFTVHFNENLAVNT